MPHARQYPVFPQLFLGAHLIFKPSAVLTTSIHVLAWIVGAGAYQTSYTIQCHHQNLFVPFTLCLSVTQNIRWDPTIHSGAALDTQKSFIPRHQTLMQPTPHAASCRPMCLNAPPCTHMRLNAPSSIPVHLHAHLPKIKACCGANGHPPAKLSGDEHETCCHSCRYTDAEELQEATTQQSRRRARQRGQG